MLARPLSRQLAPHFTRSMGSKRHRPPGFRESLSRDASSGSERRSPPLPDDSAPAEPPVSPPPSSRDSEPLQPFRAREHQPSAPQEPSEPLEPPVSPPPPSSSEPGPSQAQSVSSEPAQPLPAAGLPSLDFAPDLPGQGGRTGARAARNNAGPTPGERMAGRFVGVVLAVGLGASIWHLGRDWEPEELRKRRRVRDASCFVTSHIDRSIDTSAHQYGLLGFLATRKNACDGGVWREW